MVHIVSTILGALFAVLWIAGLVRHIASTWLVWLMGAAAVFSLGAGFIDRKIVTHKTRAQTLVVFAIVIAGALLIDAAALTEIWFVGAAGSAAAVAFVVGIYALIRR